MPDYNIKRGMTVYTADNQALGTVDDINDNYFMANGQQYPLNGGYRVQDRNIYLTGNANYAGTDRNSMKVPVYEEQLNVEKRQSQLGEVQIHKTVNQEQVNVPVELRREEVSVDQRDVNNRPLEAGEAAQAFQEGTIRVPVRGEEAVVNKQAVVTGEVNINKNVTAEQQTISDTVRREQVNVDDSGARQARNTGYNTNQNYNTGNRQDNANYAGTNYRQDNANYAGSNTYAASNIQEGQDVVGNDGEYIGRVKRMSDNDFRVDRKMKPDITVTYTSIQNVDGSQIVLNAPASDYNNLI
jgi:uncharacterized protein (TIGR02271 family)